MKLCLWMLSTAGLIAGASLCFESCDVTLARLKFARNVEKLRPLVASPRFDATPDAETIACMARLVELDEELDRLAPYSQNAGAGMTWNSVHRGQLLAIARETGPVLDALAQLAEERRERGPLPSSPKLWKAMHRANLLCVAALAESDDLRARKRFEQAWDVAQLEDDGGWIAASTQLSSAGIISRAVRQRAGRHERDAELARWLSAQFEASFQCRFELERTARDFLHIVDRPAGREICIEEFQRWTQEAKMLYPALLGEIDVATMREEAQRQGRVFLGLSLCEPGNSACRDYLRL